MKNKILSHLPPDHPWGQSLYWYDTTPSTNALAKAMSHEGAPHGTILLADSQSAGRGRLGRNFCSQAGAGIYMSVILRPNCTPDALMHLTCAVGVAVCDAIAEVTGFHPGIKWINDLVAKDKKLGGILTELVMDGGIVRCAVVGIGINCSQSTADFPPELQNIACSLSAVTGKHIDRAKLAAALICHLEKMSESLQDRQSIMDRYRSNCVTIGKDITVIRGDLHRPGRALNVHDDGSLLVQFQDGTTELVNSGEVSVRGLFGYT
jgi:BirA family biotin operon repressor/biotin-[acetyl-CoA-carboxylase] ligase